MKRRDAREIAFTIVFEMTYHTDTVEEIIHKIAEYNAKVQDIRREISINDFRV